MTGPATGPATGAGERGPHDRHLARRAAGRLRDLNRAGLLDAADVHVAQRLGSLAAESEESVVVAVALAVRAVRAGSVCVDLNGVAEGDPEIDWPEPGSWVAAVAASPLSGAGVLHLEGPLLYLARYWQEETQVVGDLRRRDEALRPPSTPAPGDLEQALAAYFPDQGSADQRDAAETAWRRWTTVLTGGPGTGKTTTIARLLGVLLAMEGSARLRVALAAPTGKAAARMGQAVREATDRADFPGSADDDPADATARWERVRALEPTTVHRLLGWRPDSSARFRHGRQNPLPYDVVVVDEASMLSLTMTARLLEAVRPQARLVLVGDADQLTSVEAGAVLGDVVRGWSARGPVRELTTTRRFGLGIHELARAIRDGRPDDVLALLEQGADHQGEAAVQRVEAGPELDALLRRHAEATHAAAASGDPERALEAAEAHRLLCAHRRGPYGVSHWNRHVERLLMEALGADWLPEWYPGRPFVVDSNDRGLRLWNGDTGVACRTGRTAQAGRTAGAASTADRLVGVIGDRSTGARVLPTTRLADVSTAHAMTVHRSQGSQFVEVTVLLPEPESRILTRELLYTAVTRARSRVRVLGSDEAIRAAVERPARRATGLAGRLS